MNKFLDNYPDDIRSFDKDPRSPFYVEPSIACKNCNKHYEECESYDPSDDYDLNLGGFFCCKECYEDYYRCSSCAEVICKCE